MRKRQNDRQLAAINEQMQTIAAEESLDAQIEKTLEELLAHPSEDLYRKVVKLIKKRQEELFDAIQFHNVEEFFSKQKVISDLIAKTLSTIDDVLLEKGHCWGRIPIAG